MTTAVVGAADTGAVVGTACCAWPLAVIMPKASSSPYARR
jgi:hypothetical protein